MVKVLSKFKMEFNNSVNTAIVAAFGFLIALSWRDFIIEWVNLISAYSPLQGQLISTVIITVISVVGIIITTKVFSPKKVEAKS